MHKKVRQSPAHPLYPSARIGSTREGGRCGGVTVAVAVGEAAESSRTPEGCAAQRQHNTMASAEEGVPPSGAGLSLADEIRAMKPSGRRKRATAAGATDDEVEACEDADDPVVAVSPRHVGPLSSLRCLAAIGPRCSASLCFATVLDSSWS